MRTSHKAKDAAAEKQSYVCDAFTGHDKAHQPQGSECELDFGYMGMLPDLVTGRRRGGRQRRTLAPLRIHDPTSCLA